MKQQTAKPVDRNKYPRGWDLARTRAVIAHYEKQTDDEAIAEAETAWINRNITLMRVPTPLADKVGAMIKKYKSSQKARPAAKSRKTKPKRAA